MFHVLLFTNNYLFAHSYMVPSIAIYYQLFVCTQLNGIKYCYITEFNTSHLFVHSLKLFSLLNELKEICLHNSILIISTL